MFATQLASLQTLLPPPLLFLKFVFPHQHACRETHTQQDSPQNSAKSRQYRQTAPGCFRHPRSPESSPGPLRPRSAGGRRAAGPSRARTASRAVPYPAGRETLRRASPALPPCLSARRAGHGGAGQSRAEPGRAAPGTAAPSPGNARARPRRAPRRGRRGLVTGQRAGHTRTPRSAGRAPLLCPTDSRVRPGLRLTGWGHRRAPAGAGLRAPEGSSGSAGRSPDLPAVKPSTVTRHENCLV